jgi:cell division protein FtsB
MGQDENKELRSIFEDEVDEAAKTATYEKNTRVEMEPPSPKSKGHSLVVWGLGIIIVIILLAVFFRGSRAPGSKDLDIMGQRIEHLDARVVRLESFGKKVVSMENQFAALEQALSALEASNRALKEQVSDLSRKTQNLSTGTPSVPAKPQSPPPSQQTKPQYHEVSRGETLFRISKKYGITVNQLRQLNSLKKNQDIYPGQKLLVKPGSP